MTGSSPAFCRPGGAPRRVRVCPSWRGFGSFGPPSHGRETLRAGLATFRLRSVCSAFTTTLLSLEPVHRASPLLHRSFTNVNSERSSPLHDDTAPVDGLVCGDDAAAADVADIDRDAGCRPVTRRDTAR